MRTSHEDIDAPQVEHNRKIVAFDTTDMDAAALSDAESHGADPSITRPSAGHGSAQRRPPAGRGSRDATTRMGTSRHKPSTGFAPRGLAASDRVGDDEDFEDGGEDGDDDHDVATTHVALEPWEWAPEDKQRLIELGMEGLPTLEVAPMMVPQNKEEYAQMRRDAAYEWYGQKRPGLIPFEHQPKPVFSDTAKERVCLGFLVHHDHHRRRCHHHHHQHHYHHACMSAVFKYLAPTTSSFTPTPLTTPSLHAPSSHPTPTPTLPRH